MAIPTTPHFLDALRKLPLLEESQKDELATLQKQFPDPRALAKELIQRGWLTPYQVNLLLQGRGNELVLGPYVVLNRLGEGGMGTVYKARHRQMRRLVALKVMRKERLANPTAVRRFQNEITAAAQLVNPHIVVAFDTGQVGNTHYFSMEYVDGIDLNQLVQQQGPLPVRVACDYIRQAALGLQHAHEHGLTHRDIKPHNLLLQPPKPGVKGTGTVKILDMGLARLAGPLTSDDDRTGSSAPALRAGATEMLTQDGAILGTPDYIAPEQARAASSVDVRADLYSLGCVFYFLLTGQPPFPGNSVREKLLKHQLEQPQPVERLRPEVPADVAAIVHRLLAKRPEDRYQTPRELAEALMAVLVAGQRGSGAGEVGGKHSALPAAGKELLVLSGRFGKWLVLNRWGRRVLAGSAGALAMVLFVAWILSPQSGPGGTATAPAGQPGTATWQYVKGKSREETIAATVHANRLPSLEGNLYVIGPFESPKGADIVHPPEKEIDLTKKYPGKDGQEVAWTAVPALPIYAGTGKRLTFSGTDSSCYYVYQRLASAAPTTCPFYCGEAGLRIRVKVWLNGKPVSRTGDEPFLLELNEGQNDFLVRLQQPARPYWRVGLSSQLEKAFGLRLELDGLDFGKEYVVEGETLKVLRKSGEFAAAPQDMRDITSSWWKGNSQLQVRSAQPGAWMEFELPLSNTRRTATVYLTKAPDHGIVQLSVNDIPLGDRIDLYHPNQMVNSGAIKLGRIPDSSKSPAVLRVEVVGSNASSSGIRHGWGLDCILFQAQ